jgi:hypothetical protein
VEAGRSPVQGQPRKGNENPVSKKKGRAGGVAQVIEWLPTKLEAPSSNPSSANKIK